MNGVTEQDWYAWHSEYDEPGTYLARRLAAIQEQIRSAPGSPNGLGCVPGVLPGLAGVVRPAGSLRPVRDPGGDLAS